MRSCPRLVLVASRAWCVLSWLHRLSRRRGRADADARPILLLTRDAHADGAAPRPARAARARRAGRGAAPVRVRRRAARRGARAREPRVRRRAAGGRGSASCAGWSAELAACSSSTAPRHALPRASCCTASVARARVATPPFAARRRAQSAPPRAARGRGAALPAAAQAERGGLRRGRRARAHARELARGRAAAPVAPAATARAAAGVSRAGGRPHVPRVLDGLALLQEFRAPAAAARSACSSAAASSAGCARRRPGARRSTRASAAAREPDVPPAIAADVKVAARARADAARWSCCTTPRARRSTSTSTCSRRSPRRRTTRPRSRAGRAPLITAAARFVFNAVLPRALPFLRDARLGDDMRFYLGSSGRGSESAPSVGSQLISSQSGAPFQLTARSTSAPCARSQSRAAASSRRAHASGAARRPPRRRRRDPPERRGASASPPKIRPT